MVYRLLRAPSRGDNLSFLGVIGSVEKFPLVDLQLYFLIYKPEFTWNYDGIMMEFRTFWDILGQISYQLTLLE